MPDCISIAVSNFCFKFLVYCFGGITFTDAKRLVFFKELNYEFIWLEVMRFGRLREIILVLKPCLALFPVEPFS